LRGFNSLTVPKFHGLKSCASPFSKQSRKKQTNIKESEERKLMNIKKIPFTPNAAIPGEAAKENAIYNPIV
jgi:hypothetical protein